MTIFVPLSFLPFLVSLISGASTFWQRLFLTVPLILVLVHLLVQGTRWQLVPVYLLATGTLLMLLLTRGSLVLPNWVALTGLAASVLLLGSSTLLVWAFPDIHLPVPRGPMVVGTTVRTFDDVTIRLWYPADPDAKAVSYTYLDGVETEILGTPSFLYSHLQGKPTAVRVDPPMDPALSTCPVVVYLYGAYSFAEDNTFRLMELASQGFIVAAVMHAKPFGIYGLSMADAADPEPFARRLAERPIPDGVRDVRVAVQGLEQLHQDDPLFHGRLALSRLGMMGYSLGGGVASEYCLESGRCHAIVNLDGSGFANARAQGVGAAFLQLSQSVALPLTPVAHPTTASEKVSAYYRAEVGDVLRHTQTAYPTYWYRLENSGHASFTDLMHWMSLRVGPVGMMLGTGDPKKLQEALDDVVVAFFREHLRSEPGFEVTVNQYADLFTPLSY